MRDRSVVSLESLVTPRGLQTGPFGSQLKAEEYADRGVPVVMPKDICSGKITVEGIARVPEEKAKKLCKHRLLSGDILFPRRGDLGRIAVVREENVGWLCGSGCLRARLKRSVDADYIYQYLQLSLVKRWLESNALGQTMLNLNTEIIGNMPIFIVPIDERIAIASFLSTWDHAIEKMQCLIMAKEKQFSWLLNRMINKESAAEEWRWMTLGEVFSSKQLVVEKGRSVIKNNIIEGSIPVVAGGQTYAYFHNMATHEMQTMTISASGAHAGFVWFHDYPIWASDCNVIYAINASLKFFYYVLKLQQDKIYALQSGGAQPHVYVKDLRNLIVPVPPVNVQEQIATTLNAARKEIDLLKKQTEAYRKQKHGLMQKLLTGHWRVKAPKEFGIG